MNRILSLFLFCGLCSFNLGASAFASEWLAECDEGSLSVFKVEALAPLSDEVNYCEVPRSQVPPSVLAALRQVVDLNTQGARLFGLTPKQILPTRMRVLLSGSQVGAIDSSAGSDHINMGVYRPESATEGPLWIDPSVYLHELGHVLALTPTTNVPGFVRRWGYHPFFVENFADSIALAATGRLQTPYPGDPRCLSNIRSVDKHQTYRIARGYFDTDFAFRRLQACCTHMRATQATNDLRLGNFCKIIDQWSPSFTAFDRRPFDPSAPDFNLERLDPHQVGIPFNAFLVDLSQKMGWSLQRLYFDTLKGFKGDTFSQFFDRMRARLNPEQRIQFDVLWKKHGMDLGIQLALIPVATE